MHRSPGAAQLRSSGAAMRLPLLPRGCVAAAPQPCSLRRKLTEGSASGVQNAGNAWDMQAACGRADGRRKHCQWWCAEALAARSQSEGRAKAKAARGSAGGNTDEIAGSPLKLRQCTEGGRCTEAEAARGSASGLQIHKLHANNALKHPVATPPVGSHTSSNAMDVPGASQCLCKQRPVALLKQATAQTCSLPRGHLGWLQWQCCAWVWAASATSHASACWQNNLLPHRWLTAFQGASLPSD